MVVVCRGTGGGDDDIERPFTVAAIKGTDGIEGVVGDNEGPWEVRRIEEVGDDDIRGGEESGSGDGNVCCCCCCSSWNEGGGVEGGMGSPVKEAILD